MFITSGYIIVAFFVIVVLVHLITFDYKKEKMAGLFASMVTVMIHAYMAYWVYTATTLLK